MGLREELLRDYAGGLSVLRFPFEGAGVGWMREMDGD